MTMLVSSYAEEWASLSETVKQTREEPVPSRRKIAWKKPPPEYIKINCDSAFSQELLSGGWGYVMRGYGRLGSGEGAGGISHGDIACLQALQRASELGIQKVLLETDAMMVAQAVNSPAVDRSSASGLLWVLKESLFCNFSSSAIVYNPRSCNLVAHSLAALGAGLGPGTNPITDSIPTCINVFVANDLASSSE